MIANPYLTVHGTWRKILDDQSETRRVDTYLV